MTKTVFVAWAKDCVYITMVERARLLSRHRKWRLDAASNRRRRRRVGRLYGWLVAHEAWPIQRDLRGAASLLQIERQWDGQACCADTVRPCVESSHLLTGCTVYQQWAERQTVRASLTVTGNACLLFRPRRAYPQWGTPSFLCSGSRELPRGERPLALTTYVILPCPKVKNA